MKTSMGSVPFVCFLSVGSMLRAVACVWNWQGALLFNEATTVSALCFPPRQHETVIPGDLPLIQEVTTTLREWSAIWRQLYVVRRRDSCGFFFNGRIIALQYFVGLCHSSAWISHRWFITYLPSLLKHPLPAPTPSDSTRLSQNTELSFLHPTTHSHWLSILHVVMYMFLCCFLNPSPSPLPLPSPLLCPQFSFLRLCLHCCPVDRFISTIFLDSMRAVASVSESVWPYGL